MNMKFDMKIDNVISIPCDLTVTNMATERNFEIYI
jgi:hypothetical protein